jgi:hypothetical protein
MTEKFNQENLENRLYRASKTRLEKGLVFEYVLRDVTSPQIMVGYKGVTDHTHIWGENDFFYFNDIRGNYSEGFPVSRGFLSSSPFSQKIGGEIPA